MLTGLLCVVTMASQVPIDPLLRKADANVIGAGMSGLAAARRLAMDGFKVKVLEAGDRTGVPCAIAARRPQGLFIFLLIVSAQISLF